MPLHLPLCGAECLNSGLHTFSARALLLKLFPCPHWVKFTWYFFQKMYLFIYLFNVLAIAPKASCILEKCSFLNRNYNLNELFFDKTNFLFILYFFFHFDFYLIGWKSSLIQLYLYVLYQLYVSLGQVLITFIYKLGSINFVAVFIVVFPDSIEILNSKIMASLLISFFHWALEKSLLIPLVFCSLRMSLLIFFPLFYKIL